MDVNKKVGLIYDVSRYFFLLFNVRTNACIMYESELSERRPAINKSEKLCVKMRTEHVRIDREDQLANFPLFLRVYFRKLCLSVEFLPWKRNDLFEKLGEET